MSLFFAAFLAFASSIAAMESSDAVRGRPALKPSATLGKVWIDFDVEEGGKQGIRVHAAFTVREMKGVDGLLRFRIMDPEGGLLEPMGDGEPLQVTVAIKPARDPMEYEDVAVFLAYESFGPDAEGYELGVDVDVCYPDGDLIDHLTTYDFEFSPGAGAVRSDAQLVKKWIDMDVTRDGRRGMLLHLSLDQVIGLKGVPSVIVVRIRTTNEEYVRGVTSAYSNGKGEFQARLAIKPAFDSAKYDDAQIFIPYDEMTLGPGTHKVWLDIDLMLEKGGLLKHFDFHEVQIKR